VTAAPAVGDILESGIPFPGMVDEPFVWTVTSVSAKGVINFDVTWHGVMFCRYSRKASAGDKAIWRREEIA